MRAAAFKRPNAMRRSRKRDALASGKVDAKPMITDVIGLDEVPAMFDALRKPGTRAKVLVEFPH